MIHRHDGHTPRERGWSRPTRAFVIPIFVASAHTAHVGHCQVIAADIPVDEIGQHAAAAGSATPSATSMTTAGDNTLHIDNLHSLALFVRRRSERLIADADQVMARIQQLHHQVLHSLDRMPRASLKGGE